MSETVLGLPGHKDSLEPLNQFQPVAFGVPQIDDPDRACADILELRLRHEIDTSYSKIGVSLLQVIHHETHMTRAELVLVEMAIRCQRFMVMNQLDLVATLEALAGEGVWGQSPEPDVDFGIASLRP